MSTFDSKGSESGGSETSPKGEADAKVGAALARSGEGSKHESGASFHTDPVANDAAGAVGAKAFTAGKDVFFGAGQHDPGSEKGHDLIQHELTHVEQNKASGAAAPKPGNFRVASTDDSAEAGVKDGSGSGATSAGTLYRDPTPGGGTPPTTGTGPVAGGGPAPEVDAITGATPPPDPYELWKTSVNLYKRDEAIANWGTCDAAAKAKFKKEDGTFQSRVIFTMKKDSVKVFKDGGVNITDNNNSYSIFLKDDFAEWLPELRTALFLTPFLNAEPLKARVDQGEAAKLKTWIDNPTTTRLEAKAIFEKAYPTLHDSGPGGFGGTAVQWPLGRIQQLFGVLAQYLTAGHAATVSGGFLFISGVGFGWWNSNSKKVWLPASGNGPGHDMTGGTSTGIKRSDTFDNKGAYNSRSGRAVSADYTGKDGTAKTGAPAGIGHMVGTILHEVGHGVGDQLDGGRGNKYAENKENFPGFNKIGIDEMVNALWKSGTTAAGAAPAVHKNAKLDESHAKDFFKTELNSGKGTYSPGWTNNPTRADMAKYCKWRYSDVPLMKFWDYYVELGHPKDPSYAWDEEDARIPNNGAFVYGWLQRGGMGWTKYNKTAWTKKVSWYSLSSPREWFAEQYAHFYRTEKTGSGIDGDTLKLLQDLDKQEFVPTAGGGTTIPGEHAGGSTGSGVGNAPDATPGATANEAAGAEKGPAYPTEAGPDRPLFFPWD